MKRFELDAEQTDAILELKIYRLARLEILDHPQRARGEAQARAPDRRAAQGRGRAAGRWSATELEEIQHEGTATSAARSIASDTGEPEYSADDFIVEEDNVVIVSRDGWVKRQKEVKDLSTTRLREGDSVLAALRRQHARDVRVLQQLRRRLHVPHHRRAGVDRLRRADPAAVQAEGRREGRRPR